MALGRIISAACSRWTTCARRHAVPPLNLRFREHLHRSDAAQAAQAIWRRARAPVQRGPLLQAAPAGEAEGRRGDALPQDEEVQRSKQLIQKQQEEMLQSHAHPYDLTKTRKLVEAAMLAAVTGLAYTLATLLKLESYLGYFLPLPVIIASLRSGPAAGLKTVTTAFLLLFILMGPVKALTYLLIYGVLSLVLGMCWAVKLPWALCIPLAASARVAGYLVYVKLASWVMNEDLMALIITNVHSLLDQLSSTLGATGAPSLLAVSVTIGSILLVNSVIYVAMMHVLFAILLKGLGLEISPMPAAVHRFVYRGAVGQQGMA